MAAIFNVQFPSAVAVVRFQRVEADQHRLGLQAAQQIPQAIQFIQHLGAFVVPAVAAFQALGLAFQQIQAIVLQKSHVHFVQHAVFAVPARDLDAMADILQRQASFEALATLKDMLSVSPPSGRL